MTSPRVVFVHPALTEYRRGLFDALVTRLDPHFVFVGTEAQTRHFLPLTRVTRYSLLHDRSLGPYRQGVSGQLVRHAATWDYDVWMGSTISSFCTHAAWPVVKARRRPFLFWSEDWWWPSGIEGRVAALVGRGVATTADGIVVAGQRSRDFFLHMGVEASRIFVAPNSCAVPHRAGDPEVREARARVGVGADAPLLLYLNRIVEYKGLDVLIRAFADLRRLFPTAALAVVGDGAFRPVCETLARELGVAASVAFVGRVEPHAVAAWYQAATVYVQPARMLTTGRVRAEAWGFTVNEALGLACPVVATDAVAAAVDLIEEEVSGHVVTAGDTAALGNALERVLRRTDRHAMGQRGRARVEREFTPDRQAEGFETAVTAVLARRGPR